MSSGSYTQRSTSQQGQGDGFRERTLIMDSMSAHFEKDKDLIGSQDPYFILTLCGDEVKTRTIKSGGVNPVWEPEEGYRLHDRGEHPELLAHAMNKNTLLKDTSLGEGKIAMADLGSGGMHSIPLYNKKGDRTGEFKFRAKEEQGAANGEMPAQEQTQQAIPQRQPAVPVVPVVPVVPAPVVPSQSQRVFTPPSGPTGTTGMLRAGSIEPLASNDEKTAHLHKGDFYLRGQGPTSQGYQQSLLQSRQGPQQMPMSGGAGRDIGVRQTVLPAGVGAGAGVLAGGAGFPPRDNVQARPTEQQGFTQQGSSPGVTQGQAAPGLGGEGVPVTQQSHEAHGRGGYCGPSQGVVGGGELGGVPQTTGASRGFSGVNPGVGTAQQTPSAYNDAQAEPARGGVAGLGMMGGQPRESSQTLSQNLGGTGSGGTGSRPTGSSFTQGGPQSSIGGKTTSQPDGSHSEEQYTSKTTSNANPTEASDGSQLAPGQRETTRRVKTTEDTDKEESSEYYHKGFGGGPIPDLETGDEHWEKSLAASAEARRQAQLVEQASRETHSKLLAAQEATRAFDKARREHMAIEERLAALDLEAKRAQFERDSTAYEQLSRTVSSKARDALTAQEAADMLRLAVNEKGEALDAEVQETKMHQNRLATLEQELARLRSEHDNASSAHGALLADLTPKREKHNTLKEHFHMIRSELLDHQRKRAVLEMKEAELEGQLSTHNAEFEAVSTELAEHGAMAEKRAMAVSEAEEERRQREEELSRVTATLADHRQRIGVLKQDTEAALATAEELEHEARERERVAREAEQRMAQDEAMAGQAARDLSQAETDVKPLHERIVKETTIRDQQHELVEEWHRKLGMAKAEVDKAQARKEELWEKAKYYGELADKEADSHYRFAHKEFKQILPGSRLMDPAKMTSQGSTTASVLRQAGENL